MGGRFHPFLKINCVQLEMPKLKPSSNFATPRFCTKVAAEVQEIEHDKGKDLEFSDIGPLVMGVRGREVRCRMVGRFLPLYVAGTSASFLISLFFFGLFFNLLARLPSHAGTVCSSWAYAFALSRCCDPMS